MQIGHRKLAKSVFMRPMPALRVYFGPEQMDIERTDPIKVTLSPESSIAPKLVV